MGSAPLQHEQLPSLKHIVSSPFGDLSEGLETPVQLLYLVTLLGFLVVGAYLVVRQVTLLLISKMLSRCMHDGLIVEYLAGRES